MKKYLYIISFLLTVGMIAACCEYELGEIVRTDAPDANPCIDDLIAQFEGDSRLNIRNPTLSYKMNFPKKSKAGAHIQGITRLRDWNGRGRVAVVDNFSSNGFRILFQESEGALESILSTNTRLREQITFNINNNPDLENLDHPGGIQAQGDIVAIAMEQDAKRRFPAIIFLNVDGDQISHIQSFVLDGSRGEPFQADKRSILAVGFVKLQSGRYLMAAGGGNKRIWFYESDGPEITESTQWDFLDFYQPNCKGFGEETEPEEETCYIGAQGGLNLQVACDGSIYLFGMYGQAKVTNNFESLQVFRLSLCQEREGRSVRLEKVKQQRDPLERSVLLTKSFRWSGGTYVTRDGRLAIFNSERNARQDRRVEGHIYMSARP